MQPCQTDTQRTMTELLDAIEDYARSRSSEVQENRSEIRRPLHVECDVCVFTGLDENVLTKDAFARNITFMGLSVVGNFPTDVETGRAIEVIVKAPNHTVTYLAGTVVFCRSVGDDCREVGLSVKAAGCSPILINDANAAVAMYDWFAEALEWR